SKHFDGQLAYAGDTQALLAGIEETADSVRNDFELREYGRAIRRVMAFADRLNQDFDAAQPWVMAKGIAQAGDEQKAALQDVCSRALAGFRALTVMLSPVLPELAATVAQSLFSDTAPYQWADAKTLPAQI